MLVWRHVYYSLIYAKLLFNIIINQNKTWCRTKMRLHTITNLKMDFMVPS